jgi:DNA-binding transcriptional ArsR family regulator
MVKYQEQALDRMFAALADPTRRALLSRLNDLERASVSDLAAPFDMTLPAVMKHIDVLSDAGLIVRSKTGRTVTCELQAEGMETAVEWLNRYARFWSGALDRLALYAEKEEQQWQQQHQPSPPSPASPSSGGSKPRRPRSTGRGSSRKG